MKEAENSYQNAVKVRLASEAEAKSIAELAERTFRNAFGESNDAGDMNAYVARTFNESTVRAEFNKPGIVYFLAELSEVDQPVGYAKIRPGMPQSCDVGPDPLELQRIYVDHSFHRRGIGKALLDAVLTHGRNHGYRTLWLGVSELNDQALGFYRRSGFVVKGEHTFVLGSDEQVDQIHACLL